MSPNSVDTNLSLFHTSSRTPHSSPNPVRAPQSTLSLLDDLHAQSLSQEGSIDPEEVKRVGFDEFMKDKYIALDQDKCWFVYQMCLAICAKNVVEAGTSFGLSTIYLALALKALGVSPGEGRVVATENEPSKASRARENWVRAGEGISELIDLREGDLLQTLSRKVPTIDLLLLDIWAPLALPTLKIVEKSFRRGSIVIIDNSTSSATRYADLLAYLRAPGSGYTNMTVPFEKGLEVCVYLGKT